MPYTHSPSSNPLPRRTFLELALKSLLAAGSALGMIGLLRFLGHQPEPDLPTEFDLGTPDQYPAGSRTVIPEAQALLHHTAAGFLAYSLVCPHLGCQAEPDGNGFTCPCHGSKFTTRGEVERGPADRPLRALRLELASNGHLILRTSTS